MQLPHKDIQKKVSEIQIFNTILKTPDNKTIIIPNEGFPTYTFDTHTLKRPFFRIETVNYSMLPLILTHNTAFHFLIDNFLFWEEQNKYFQILFLVSLQSLNCV